MAVSSYEFSSDFSNNILNKRRKRRERTANWTDMEVGFISGGMSVMSFVMTLANMVMFSWFFLELGRTSGLTFGFGIFGLDALHLFMAAIGLSMGWMATGSILELSEAHGLPGKLLAFVLCAGLLVGSLFTSGLFNMSFFEAGEMRAEAVEAMGDNYRSQRDIAQEKVDAAKLLYDASLKDVRDAQDALSRAVLASDATRRERQEAIVKAAQSVSDAEDDLRAWEASVSASFAIGSAARNRRNSSSYPARVNFQNAIDSAKKAQDQVTALYEAAISEADAKQAEAKVWREKTVFTSRQEYGALEIQRAALTEIIAKGGDDATDADIFVRTADAYAPMFRLENGKKLLVIATIFFAGLCTLAPPMQTYIKKGGSEPAFKSAERTQRHKQALRNAEEVSMPSRSAPPAPAPQPVQVVTPVPQPEQSADHTPEQITVLMRQYSSKVFDAENDARIGELKVATYRHLKDRYGVNDDGATAIRHGLVDANLAMWDGKQCKVAA